MENKIFLLKNKSKFSLNKASTMDVNLECKERLMSSTDLSETVGLYDLYNEERDNCNNFRFIFTINPICSNVLFNSTTEAIKDEGTSACTVNNYTERLNKIRNTESSSDELNKADHWVYQCGYDIFNNHILRANNFPFIGQKSTTKKYNEAYNTFADYARDENGNVIKSIDYMSTDNKEIDCHVYNMDTLDSMSKAFSDKCIEKEGWFGFENKALIDIPNYKSGDKMFTINRVLNDRQACSFVDMFPDRTLFSFTPKYNKSRRRAERNWDYCLTYPYKSDKDFFNRINGNDKNAVKIYSYELGYTNSGEKLVRLKSLFKHNLKKGDYINLYVTDKENDEYSSGLVSPNLLGKKIVVRSLGTAEKEDEETIFNIRFDDISAMCVEKEGKIWKRFGNKCFFFFKKYNNGCESEYYFRKFKKIQYQYEDADGNLITCDPHSEINKLSFAKNIYGDDMSQIIFTDDINIEGLTDNLGRELSSVYLTIIKANRGHVEWYETKEPNYKSDKVEYSHVFGKVTSGIDLPNDYTNYNIHKLHNLDLSFNNFDNYNAGNEEVIGYDVKNKFNINEENNFVPGKLTNKRGVVSSTLPGFENDGTLKQFTTNFLNNNVEIKVDYDSYKEGTQAVFSNFLVQPKAIEDDITASDMDEFYCDIIEFNKATFKESVLDYVYHRFNTAQREYTKSNKYADIREDYIVYDDFFRGSGEFDKFTTASTFVNLVDFPGSDTQKLYLGNVNPEGYFYNPNYKVQIREISQNLSSAEGQGIYYDNELFLKDGGIQKRLYTLTIGNNNYNYDIYTIPYTEDYEFKVGDHIAFYNINYDSTIWGVVTKLLDGKIEVQTKSGDIDDSEFEVGMEMIFRVPANCPEYAKFLPSNESFVWRELTAPSKLSGTSDLYDTPYSNGAFYFEKNINFFLRRQDPHGDYYMSNPEENPQTPKGFASESRRYKKFSIGKFTFDGIRKIEDLFNSSCE